MGSYSPLRAESGKPSISCRLHARCFYWATVSIIKSSFLPQSFYTENKAEMCAKCCWTSYPSCQHWQRPQPTVSRSGTTTRIFQRNVASQQMTDGDMTQQQQQIQINGYIEMQSCGQILIHPTTVFWLFIQIIWKDQSLYLQHNFGGSVVQTLVGHILRSRIWPLTQLECGKPACDVYFLRISS